MSNAHPPMDSSLTQHQTPPGKPLVLIVEDHEDSRKMLKALLKLKDYEVIEAADGACVLDLAEARHPDLILMDISLPISDGLALYRELRNHSALGEVPIILTSGYSTEDFRARVQAAGCQEFLVKPLDFDELDRLLERHLAH
jgi:CheY-like chemotaxis protein